MKKVLFIITAMLLFLGACSSNKKSLDLTSQEVLDKLANKETFVVNLGSSTCPACIAYEPVVKEFMKNYDVEIFTVTLDKETDEDAKAALLEAMPVEYTPSTQIVIEGEVVKKYEGVLEYKKLKELLTEYGFVK